MAITYTAVEAKTKAAARAKVEAAGSRILVERGRSKAREERVVREKWQKETKRKKRRSHCPRAVFKFVARGQGLSDYQEAR